VDRILQKWQPLMTYLWFALVASIVAVVAAHLSRRPGWSLAAAVAGSLLVGVGRAAQPTLFRAENGFALALVFFGLLPLVIGLTVGFIAQRLVRR
jgi:hypothetical protein